jgi:Tfp pilus assembly protein PilE
VNIHHFRKTPKQGSALLAVIIVIAVMSYLAAASMSYSVANYRSSMRQTMLDQAKLTAEAEMEYLYFEWVTAFKEETPAEGIDDNLLGKGVIVNFTNIAQESLATTAIGDDSWTISRTLRSNGQAREGTIKVSGVTRPAQVNYFTALTRATQTHPLLGTIQYQMGRRFALNKSSLFQFSVFYQDVMEFSTGSPMTIKGDISSNGSLYIGAQSGVNLTIVNKIFYADSFNGVTDLDDAVDPTEAKFFRHGSDVPNTLDNPSFSSDPSQTLARKNQIKRLSEPENFLGGTDVDLAMEIYGPDGTKTYDSSNDVYRSIISPSPTTAAGVAIEEDPVIKANRMSEKAGITIKVRATTDSLYASQPVIIYVRKNGVNVESSADSTLINSIVTSARKSVFDTRENTNVNLTTIDIGALKTALESNTELKSAYNGIIYAYDPNAQSAGTTINGIRLTNAEELPYTETDGKPTGFTLASDNGVYVQGNYNTVTPAGKTANTEDTAGNPSSIMADAITLLSASWNDDKATEDVSDIRLAGYPVLDAEGKPTYDPETGKPIIDQTNTITSVYAALVSGNTPTDTAAGVNSGGVQNLVRLMENWSGQTVKLVGSLGQLFESKYFTGAIRGTGSGAGRNLYLVPSGRELTFDSKLASSPPSGAPVTTRFSRGDYFIWQLSDNPSSL